jgi:hypothetical protein
LNFYAVKVKKMETNNEFSIGDRKPRKPLIRHVSQIDIEAMDKLVKQLQHDRLVDKICNRIPKTWSDKQ